MRTLLAAAFLAAVFVLAGGFVLSGDSPQSAAEQRRMGMLYTVVQIENGDSRGSGTVIHAGDGKSLILTNQHVTSGAKEVKAVWFDHEHAPEYVVRKSLTAKVLAEDEKRDLALIEVEWQAERVAKLADSVDGGDIGSVVYAVGGGNGDKPFMAMGLLGLVNDGRYGQDMTLATASIAPGNSGGALFNDRFELIGTTRAVPLLNGMIPIMHMSLSVPVLEIKRFLADHDYAFVFEEGR